MMRKTKQTPNRVGVSDQFPKLTLTTINDETVVIPDPGNGLTHLQFRRFAGCPICNLHLHSISTRLDEIRAAGIREVVVFHSTRAELQKYQDDMPFSVIGDPDKNLYRRFGVEASAKAILKPGAWRGPARRMASGCENRHHQTPRTATGHADERQPRPTRRSADRRRWARHCGQLRHARLRPVVGR